MSSARQEFVTALQRWEFEPFRVRGVVRPVCLTTTVNINDAVALDVSLAAVPADHFRLFEGYVFELQP